MATASCSSGSHGVHKRLRPDLPLILCGECNNNKVVLEYRVKKDCVHCSLIPPRYYSISVDRVISAHRGQALDIARGEGEKTLGEVEHRVILWHKRYIIIPPSAAATVASPPPQPPPDDR